MLEERLRGSANYAHGIIFWNMSVLLFQGTVAKQSNSGFRSKVNQQLTTHWVLCPRGINMTSLDTSEGSDVHFPG